jgi:hypothetical protein
MLRHILFSTSIAIALAPCAAAGAGTLAVIAVVEGSLAIRVDAPGQSHTGSGPTLVVPVHIGRGTSSPIFEIHRELGVRHLSTQLDVLVTAANLGAGSCAITARLGAPAPAGTAWRMNGATLSDSFPAILTHNASLFTATPYVLDLALDESVAEHQIEDSIVLTVIAN